MTKYFEAVPNISEGRDTAKVASIVGEARAVAGVTVLDVESNADHHRSVISLVGEAGPLSEGLFRLIRKAVELIDLNGHHGEHPRMGAVDVVPFVPLGDADMAEAVSLAEALGARVWRELTVPVYLYGSAARRPERRDLAVVRKGEFEGIRDSIATDSSRAPDFGESRVHPTAGIVAIGARPVLIAYNAYLNTPDVQVAKRIAHATRERDGGLPAVKALGFEIKERNQAQVSMNLIDYRTTPIHHALEQVRREAGKAGVEVTDSEIVGLVPEDALLDAAEYYLKLEHFDRALILERKVRAAIDSATAASPDAGLAGTRFDRLTELVAAKTPTPGGGSASAAAGALAAALGMMVVAYSQPKERVDPTLEKVHRTLDDTRREFIEGVDRDSRAYEGLRRARRALREAPEDARRKSAYALSVAEAIETPLGVARAARNGARALHSVLDRLRPTLESDRMTAMALFEAAAQGALANATINLPDAESAGLAISEWQGEIDRLRGASA